MFDSKLAPHLKDAQRIIQNALNGTGLNLAGVISVVWHTLGASWSNDDGGLASIDPVPNPMRFILFRPVWLPKSMHRYLDCGEVTSQKSS